MACSIVVSLPHTSYVVDGDLLPPVGTIIDVHKYLTPGNDRGYKVEVIAHEWEFTPTVEEGGKDGNPSFHVTVRTRPLK